MRIHQPHQRRQRRRTLSRFVVAVFICLSLILADHVDASSNDPSSTTFKLRTAELSVLDAPLLPPPCPSPLAVPPSSPWNSKTKQTRDTQTSSTHTQTPLDTTNQNKSIRTSRPLLSPSSPLHRRRRRRRSPLWTIPFVASAASFVSFKRTSRIFHGVVQYMSDNTWIPKTFKELNLQANVVTQVINGPVITSISVLFASLVSMTISSLYQRQADIRLCLTNEIQAIRILQTMLLLQPPPPRASMQQQPPPRPPSSSSTPEVWHLAQAQEYLKQYIQYFAEEINSRGMKRPSRSDHNDDNMDITRVDDDEIDEPPPALLALLAWCQQEPCSSSSSIMETQLQAQPSASPLTASSSSLLYASVSDWVCRLWSERSHRHLAWTSTFPMVHYVTLTFLAVGISISFLVATDQSTSIFLEGLPVRILWSILMGSFTALAVICYDLSAPFGGAYQVTNGNDHHYFPMDLINNNNRKVL